MKRKHNKTLGLIFKRPISGSIKWADIEALLASMGATIKEGAGSRVRIKLFGEMMVFHRPHPSPDTDKRAVSTVKNWLKSHGVKP